MKHVQECKNISAGAMIVIFNYREDEKQERNKCKTSAFESAAFQVLQQPAVADISGRLEEGFWQRAFCLRGHLEKGIWQRGQLFWRAFDQRAFF